MTNIDFPKMPKDNADRRMNFAGRNEIAEKLSSIPGHPLYTFVKENEVLRKLLADAVAAAQSMAVTTEQLEKIRWLSMVHYAKKGDLLNPHLKAKYEVTGPSDVMWTDDDTLRDGWNLLRKFSDYDDRWYKKFLELAGSAENMIKKEKQILFPICAALFTEEEWALIYRDAKDYENVPEIDVEKWSEAEKLMQEKAVPAKNEEIAMPGGSMTIEQLTALLNTIPMEITFVDADNINRFFNEGPKAFKRPGMALGREVFSCHPPKIEPMVRSIIEDFRDGVRDSVPVWAKKGGRDMLVTYMAVRDREGKYVGTVELVQDMEFARKHFQKEA